MSADDENGLLPAGWSSASLGEIADCRLGKMLDQAKNQGELRPYLRNVNVQWGQIDLDDVKEMRITDEERERYAVKPGDLLVCEGGEPGRCAIWSSDQEMYLQKALHRVRPRGGTLPEYLRWWLQDAANTGRLNDLFTGSTIKHLPGRQLARVQVAVPPVDEQTRIVERLAKLDARRAAAAAHLLSARATVGRLRTAILAAACSGRLTDDWRDTNPASTADALEALLLGTPPSGKPISAGVGQAQGLTSEAQLELLPPSWSLVRIGDILNVSTGATPLRKNRGYYENGTIPWVTSGAVNAGTITTATEFITPLALAETNVKIFPMGTLLVAMYGEGQTRGRVAELAIEATTNQAMAALLFNADTAPLRPFVRLFFEDSYQRVRALSIGGVQPNLNLGMIRDTLIPLPALDEQREIIRRATLALDAASRMATQIDAATSSVSRVFNAAITQAVRGQLVPPDATIADEGRLDFESAEQRPAHEAALHRPATADAPVVV